LFALVDGRSPHGVAATPDAARDARLELSAAPGARACGPAAPGDLCGGFTLQAASTIAAIDEITGSDIVDCATNLVAKSLVAADLRDAKGWYRLLETRAYALEKLTQSGEFEQLARRHAEYRRDLFERAEVELQTRPAAEWLAAYSRRIENLRAALDWAFSPTGDVAVGVALTIAAVPLWLQLSLVQECRARVERALASLGPEAGQSAC
jgi:predicted ATPase